MSPDAVSVSVLDNYTLFVRFDNGETRLFDATPLLARKCYANLKNKAFFGLASVQYGCVTWPGNIDIDPDWLYEDSQCVATPDELAAIHTARAEYASSQTISHNAINWD